MIIDKEPFPDDPTPSEAPPSYDTIASSSSSSSTVTRLSTSKSPTSPSPSTSTLSPPLKSPTPSTSTSKRWFSFPSRTAKDVRITVLGLVRDIVQEHDPNSPAALGILQSCAEVASAHDVNLSMLLQERSIEEHTPLYWAIVKRPPDSSAGIPDLLSALLSFSTPLKPSTISDIRLACLITSDQPLFNRLRQLREFNAVSPVDEMLLGAGVPPDEVEVEEGEGGEGGFAVKLGIGKFQKRMMVAKRIEIEFIARGRMWKLEFFIASHSTPGNARSGTWCVALSLMENSPPTWIDSRLLVAEPLPLNSPSVEMDKKHKPRPTISLRMKSTTQALSPYRGSPSDKIVVSLEDSLMGGSLQYAGSKYIAEDEKLRAVLEAKLGKPESDCVIC